MSAPPASPPTPSPACTFGGQGCGNVTTQGPGVLALIVTLAGIFSCAAIVVFVFRRYFCTRQRQVQQAREAAAAAKAKPQPVKEVPFVHGVLIEHPDGVLQAAWDPHISELAMTADSMELKPQQPHAASGCDVSSHGSVMITLPPEGSERAAAQTPAPHGPEQV